MAVLHISDKCVPMETDLSCHCHQWPVKANPAPPERNQLVTWLISHQYNSVTFDYKVAFKPHASSRCQCQTHTEDFLLVSLSFNLSFPLCRRISPIMSLFLFYNGGRVKYVSGGEEGFSILFGRNDQEMTLLSRPKTLKAGYDAKKSLGLLSGKKAFSPGSNSQRQL